VPWEQAGPIVDLLEGLHNLVALTFDVHTQWSRDSVFTSCHCHIFKNCSFRLQFLAAPFVLDGHLAGFFLRQPSITHCKRLRSHVPSDECNYLSPNILPNLTFFRNANSFSRLDVEIHKGRRITHVSLYGANRQSLEIASLREVALAAPHLKALSTFCDLEMLSPVPDLFPNLECLATVDYHTNLRSEVSLFKTKSVIVCSVPRISIRSMLFYRKYCLASKIFVYSTSTHRASLAERPKSLSLL
jgi:hypothetical protein